MAGSIFGSAPGKSRASSSSSSAPRAKVYLLNDDGEWDELGTGRVSVDYMEGSDELGLIVIDEEDDEFLILHPIGSDDMYQKQKDTFIGWRYPPYSIETALSFQDAAGCSFIWDSINDVQRNLWRSTPSNKGLVCADKTSDSVDTIYPSPKLEELPAVELSTLHLILKIVVETSADADRIRLIELLLKDREFFSKLMNLFRICEDFEIIDNLHMIFKIVRGIVLLNSPKIFEKIFSDELIMDIIGSLEYDPMVPHTHQFRNFLKEHVVFKEAIRIKSPVVLSKIHQTYRVRYLKDVVLVLMLDDSMVANLNFIIDANNAMVISFLKDDSTFIQELFTRLRSPSTPDDSKMDLVCFLLEFCSLSKSLQLVLQTRFFRDLMNEGIFDIITDVLQSSDKKLVLTGTDILIVFLNQDPNLLRTHVIEQKESPLFGLLVKGLVTDFGDYMHCQFLQILRSLLETYSLSIIQRDTILEIFYEKHFGQLIDIITASCPTEGLQSAESIEGPSRRLEDSKDVKPEILSNICKLLCFCALQHPFRIKSNFLQNNMINKVVLLTRRREKYLVVSAVRFIRSLLLYHDKRVMKHFIKNNTLKPIIDAFVANGKRYNLLNSAVLELFEYIDKENLILLVGYIVDFFGNQLAPFENFSSIKALKDKYQKCLENEMKDASDTSDHRRTGDESSSEDETSDSSSGDSDEEEEDTASPPVAEQNLQSQPALSDVVATNDPQGSNEEEEDTASPPVAEQNLQYQPALSNDDENEEDNRPPQSEQPGTAEEDIGKMEVLRHKRKLAPQEEPETVKKQRQDRKQEPKDGVLASLCTALCQAVIPGIATTNATETSSSSSYENQSSVEENPETNPATSSKSSDSSSSNSDEKNPRENESTPP